MTVAGTDASPRTIGLAEWLANLPAPGPDHLVVGGTGHLLLSRTEQNRARARLNEGVLPALLSRAGLRRISLITGLAPGADLLFKRFFSDRLAHAGIAFEAIALLPVPIDVLIGDWIAKAGEESGPIALTELRSMRSRLTRMLAGCDVVVNLLPAGSTARDLENDCFRQDQYRRLAACLAQQADVLVALLREQNPQQPGGTAEVVQWRRNPVSVPPAYSTYELRRPTIGDRQLFIIDPSIKAYSRHHEQASHERQSATSRDAASAELLTRCRQSLRVGNYLQAYDQASNGRAEGLESRALEYISLLALANAGSTQLALKRFRLLGLSDHDTDEDWLALEARLLKDLALSGDADNAQTLYRRSGEAYHAAFLRTGGYFTAINAATMLLLGGLEQQALSLARDVLAQVGRLRASNEIDHYYLRVTEAEAALLLGDVERCRAILREADEFLRGNLNVRSRTASQLRLICRHLDIDEGLLNALTLAPVIYVRRLSSSASNANHDFKLPLASFVFAGITQPADLIAVEQFADHQARRHLVLPATKTILLDHWLRRHGTDWAMRLRRCLDRADEISVAQGFLDDEDDWCAAYVSTMALGLSKLNAKRLGCQWQVTDPAPSLPGNTSFDADENFDVGSPSGSHTKASGSDGRKSGRRFVGTLFADFAGYSRLNDIEIPQFQSLFLGSIGTVLRSWQDKILLRHTWGDAIHVVTVDAESSAHIAADIHAVVEKLRPEVSGTLAQLDLRLAVHYGPVHEGVDPVESTPTFFGSQLSFAARIEPITPPGMIFVTEALAARLTLDAPELFTIEYAGEINLAKSFGKYRLFSLRREKIPPGTLKSEVQRN